MIKGKVMDEDVNAGPKFLVDCDLPRVVALTFCELALHQFLNVKQY